MSLGITRAVCLFTALLGAAPAVLAQSADALFAQGVDAFKKGDYAKAARVFHDASMAGYDQPVLFYNLGASYYKLGRYRDAEDAFRTAAKDPNWAPLAHYNMGLAAYERGERGLAATYFEHTWRTTKDEKLQALAHAMLERSGVSVASRFNIDLGIGIGYDNNVTLSPGNQVLLATEEADWFSEFAAYASGRWVEGEDGVRWTAGVYSLNYHDLNLFDYTELRVGADKLNSIGNWSTEFGASYENQWLYDVQLEHVASVRVQGRRDWGEKDVLLKLKLGQINAVESKFDYLSGSQGELEASTAQRLSDAGIRLGLTYEWNQRQDLRFNGDFFSFSPSTYSAWLRVSWPIAEGWSFEPTLRYSYSTYADPDRRSDGTEKTREDRYGQLTLRIKRQITSEWRLVGEYAFIDNDSNFDEFSYTRRIVALSFRRPF